MGKSNLNRLIDSFKEASPVILGLGTTEKQYSALDYAFKLFNKECFDNTLPPVLITFQRHKKSLGYYAPDRLESRASDVNYIPEIALNIGSFGMRTDQQIFSTLLHELVHHWQHVYGKPTRNGYHNKEWGSKMKEVGLYPSNTGEVGGKELGQQMTHYIILAGKFQRLYAELKKAGVTIDWQSKEPSKEAKPSKSIKIKYTCPSCESNAWGKPELSLCCGACSNEDELVHMVSI